MSTRGFISFVIDDQVKTAYNHSDSYPSSLGATMLGWLSTADLDKSAQLARSLRPIPDAEPTEADFEQLSSYYDSNVGGRTEAPTWYQLLRRTQGEPELILAAGLFESAADFPADSLFAEYGYVADFDSGVFEAYAGFQHAPHTVGRFASMEPGHEGYAPVRLVGSWPFGALPTLDQLTAAYGDDQA